MFRNDIWTPIKRFNSLPNESKTEWWYNYQISIGGKNAVLTILFDSSGRIFTMTLNFLYTGNTEIVLI